MIIYIVVTSQHSWGKADTMEKAFENAGLVQQTEAEWFLSMIGDDEWDLQKSLRRACNDWAAFGRNDFKSYREEEIEFTVFRHDDDQWVNYNISHVDGSVSFNGYKGIGSTTPEEAFVKCFAKGTWCNGILKERK